jgi:hypothetical protein
MAAKAKPATSQCLARASGLVASANRDNPGRWAKVVPFGQLEADLTAGRLPRLVFITPNQDHDMHGAGQA